jgi:uncharacterized protein (TIGR03435 family)
VGYAPITTLCLLAWLAAAQPDDTSLRFEAASVKPAAPQDGGMRWGIDRPPGRYRATNVPLRSLLANAYVLKDYELQTPGWMDDARYDITAKASEAATKREIDVMAQNLLIERFKIEMHREQRPMPVYKLTLAAKGSKLKETALAPEPAPSPAASEPPNPQAMRAIMSAPPNDAEGFPVLKKSGWASRSEDGRTKMTAVAMSMQQLTNMLSTQLGRDVIDETGLTGKYDFRLEYANDGTMGPVVPMPVMVNRTPVEPSGAPIFKALQDYLGLKLESGKAPREVLVIDKAEKTPIEN